MDIVLVAEESAGVQALRRVAASGHRLTAVLTDSGGSDGSAQRGVTVASAAAELTVPVLAAQRVRDPGFADELRSDGVDVLLNVHSLYLVNAEVLAAPRVGAFNLHPGPLPRYAGLSVPSWAIYEGSDRHAVTLHWMEPGIDTGDVVASAEFPITVDDTGLTVSARCVELGMPLITQLLDRLGGDAARVPRHAQDLRARRYYRRRAPHDGWVPWQLPARRVVDFVRAADYGPFPSPWGVPRTAVAPVDAAAAAEFGIVRLGATGLPAARPPGTVEVSEAGVLVATGDEWVQLLRLRRDGRRADPAETLRHATSLVTPRAPG